MFFKLYFIYDFLLWFILTIVSTVVRFFYKSFMFFKLIRSRRQENYMEDEATKGDARREIFHERKSRVHFQVIWMKSNLRKSKNPKIRFYVSIGFYILVTGRSAVVLHVLLFL